MTRSTRFLIASLCLCLVTVASLTAQQSDAASNATIPHLIRFSGLLNDISGKPAQGTVGVTFAFYSEQQGGVPLWMETQNVTPDASGRYWVMLGATKSDGLPVELFISKEARWLSVEPQGLPAPARILLLSVPYALKAADAETVGGLPPSAFVLAAPASSASPSTAASSTSAPPPASGVTTAGGTVNLIPLWSTATDIENSAISQTGSGTTAKIGINTTAPATTLDVKGNTTIRGTLSLPAIGAATATAGKNSQPTSLAASSFNSSNSTAVTQTFQFKAEPAGNNTATPSGTLNVLYGAGTSAPAETGLKIASNGKITFATGQTFPGTGNGTITGVAAGIDLTGGGTTGGVTLNVDTTKVVTGVVAGTGLTGGGTGGVQTLNLDTSKVPQLNVSNTFAGNQSILGNLTSTGTVTGNVVNASSYSIGGSITPFLSGSINSNNAFLGFAGNSATTGINNIASGPSALLSNTTGSYNTADGPTALTKNTTGSSNVADGSDALGNNTTGGSNTAVGGVALTSNITGSYNTGLGYGAGPDVNSPALTNATAVGAFATVSKSNALVLGGTGANAVNVGIGTATPASTLDVHGTGNFTGPITFAAGQTFPGAGTITGVTAGTGLSGGGTSGTVSLSLNAAYSDGRYAQLAANNTFSGVQVINNNVGIGISSPVYALHTMGTIRSETGGLSIGGNAPVVVDAPGIIGGRLTILANGKVGINNPNPSTNLDVVGNIDASGALIGGSLNVAGGGVINGSLTTSAGITTGAGVGVGAGLTVAGNTTVGGSLRIKNDTPMNAAPHMYFGGFFPGNIVQGEVGGYIVPSKDILITRVTLAGGSLGLSFSGGCSPPGTIGIINMSGGLSNLVPVYLQDIVNNSTSSYITDSGALSILVSGGTPLVFEVWVGPVCGLNPGPNNINLSVEYVMQ